MKAKTILLLILFLTLSSCRSKKVVTEKKEEKVNVLQQKDIQTSEKIIADVTTYRILKNQNIKVVPVDNERPVRVIYGKDTLDLDNGVLEINSTNTREKVEDKTVSEKKQEDNSRKEIETSTEEKNRKKSIFGTSPALTWGLILAGLAVGIMIYFRKSIPFL